MGLKTSRRLVGAVSHSGDHTTNYGQPPQNDIVSGKNWLNRNLPLGSRAETRYLFIFKMQQRNLHWLLREAFV
jgi:hypothetical protein